MSEDNLSMPCSIKAQWTAVSLPECSSHHGWCFSGRNLNFPFSSYSMSLNFLCLGILSSPLQRDQRSEAGKDKIVGLVNGQRITT